MSIVPINQFIAINCGAFQKAWLKAIFVLDMKKGAFTGARAGTPTVFWTIWRRYFVFDEVDSVVASSTNQIASCDPGSRVERVGGKQTLAVDENHLQQQIRIWKDLLKQDMFRNDLYYRINVVRLSIPPFGRERPEEILPYLVQLIIQRLNNRDTNKQVKSVSREVMQKSALIIGQAMFIGSGSIRSFIPKVSENMGITSRAVYT